MPLNLTATDIVLDTARIWSVPDPEGGPLKVYVTTGFDYVINGNLRLHDEYTKELTGARRTSVINFFTNLKADILTEKGI